MGLRLIFVTLADGNCTRKFEVMGMKEYHVSYMCIYSEIVMADSPKEAADMVEQSCPYDVDGLAWVTDTETGEEFEV